MQRFIVACVMAFAVAVVPFGTTLWANDAHHPDKAGSGRKKPGVKPKQLKSPPSGSNKTTTDHRLPVGRAGA